MRRSSKSMRAGPRVGGGPEAAAPVATSPLTGSFTMAAGSVFDSDLVTGFALVGFLDLPPFAAEAFAARERCAHASEFRSGRGDMPRRLATRAARRRRR